MSQKKVEQLVKGKETGPGHRERVQWVDRRPTQGIVAGVAVGGGGRKGDF